MATLTDPMKQFIVERLACYESPTKVAKAVQEEFGVELHRRGLGVLLVEYRGYGLTYGMRVSFVDRFDANSYLYITRALDYFDLAEEHGGTLANAFTGDTRFCLVSFDTDWLYPTSESRTIVHALNAAGVSNSNNAM